MSKYTFTCEYEDIFTSKPDGKITLEVTEDSLTNVVEAFERFLRGAGFVFDGHLDIVDDDLEFEPERFEVENEFSAELNDLPRSVTMPMPGTIGGATYNYNKGEKCHRRGCGLTRDQLGAHKCYDEHCGMKPI